jgi:DNA-binding response OmpR family regulator
MNESKITILLAEDEEFLAKTYKNRLELEGFEVIVATDGQEALDRLSEIKPDLMLLDLLMPNKNGFEVLKEISKRPELKDVPVIVSSNLGQDSDVKEARGLGAIDYIVKSDISLKDMVEKIRNNIKTK